MYLRYMTVSQHMARARGRLAHHAHHAHHRHRCRGLDAREGKPEARVDRRVATAVVETPSGPEAADAALAWLAREFVWQSTLERLGARSGS
jgi:hypothetical protein